MKGLTCVKECSGRTRTAQCRDNFGPHNPRFSNSGNEDLTSASGDHFDGFNERRRNVLPNRAQRLDLNIENVLNFLQNIDASGNLQAGNRVLRGHWPNYQLHYYSNSEEMPTLSRKEWRTNVAPNDMRRTKFCLSILVT